MNIFCKLFGHKFGRNIPLIDVKRRFTHCSRCYNGLKVVRTSYDSLRIEKDYGEQRTFCWCDCGNELCSSESYIPKTDDDMSRLEFYRCSHCGIISAWDFDLPVPFRVLSTPPVQKHLLRYNENKRN